MLKVINIIKIYKYLLLNNIKIKLIFRHKGLQECTANPECGWCSSDDTCYGRNGGINCTTNLQTTRCPGICSALTDCHSCLIHGESTPFSNNQSTTSVAHIMQLGRCVWCIQDGRCHHKNGK